MIIIKDKGNNSRIFVARSNASMDTSNLYVTEKDVRRILQSYLLKGEFDEELAKKQDNNIQITQAEYDELLKNGQIDDETLYMIMDAVVSVPYLTGEQMVEYVDDTVGDINKILEDILG